MFQKLPELSFPPFGLNRFPPSQFFCRLKGFPPNLTDAIVVASPASSDINLVTRSKTPLTSNSAAEKVVDCFTTTQLDDSRRAQLPFSKESTDTSPIGVTFDMSSKDKVKRPLPGEEYEESPGPLPALMVLNNEGILAAWWFVYAESIRQATSFPGLSAVAGSQGQGLQTQGQASPFAATTQTSASGFGQSSFGKPSTPANAFGAASGDPATPAFGSSSTPGSAFGAPSGLGQTQSPWASSSNTAGGQASAPAFGKPAFGSSTPMGASTQGTAFGMAGGMANRGSPWGAPSTGTAAITRSAFGQPAKMGSQPSQFSSDSPAGVLSSNAEANKSSNPTTGGFASFANKSVGFGAANPSSSGTQSLFGNSSTGAAFGTSTGSSFGQPAKQEDQPQSIFGGGGFKLGSTFKSDGSAANDAPKPTGSAANSMFGNAFGSTLEAAAPQSKDEDMDVGEDSTTKYDSASQEKPDTKSADEAPALPKFGFPQTDPPKTGGLFGTQSQSQTVPAQIENSKPVGFSFGKPTPLTTTPKDTPKKTDDKPKPALDSSPEIKDEPDSEDNISPLNDDEKQSHPVHYGEESKSDKSPEPQTPDTPASKSAFTDPPLPPESTSKASYAPGDSSNSSKSSDDAPGQPDFAPQKSRLQEVEPASPESTRLPDEEVSGTEEGEEDESETEGEDGEGEVHHGIDREEGELDEESGSEEQDGPLDDEGSGVDVGQEISPPSSKESSKLTPGSSFGMPPGKGSPTNLFSTTVKPSEQAKIPLFGEVGKPTVPLLPTSGKTQESQRSPSPIRSSSRLESLRPDNARSVSAPGPQSPLNRRGHIPTQVVVPSKPQVSAAELRQQEQDRLRSDHLKKSQEEHQPLEDSDDDKIQEELNSEPQPTKKLYDFVAHQDYVGVVDKPGIPGQIEKLFRDVNSMIDTLGVNARSLKCFTLFHQQPAVSRDRTSADLEELTDWGLVEIADLGKIEDTLSDQIKSHGLPDVPGKLNELREIQKDVSNLRHQSQHPARTIDIRKDPLATESAARAPLSLDQATQLQDLRKSFTHFQKQLAEAEEGVTLLRTKVAFAETQGTSKQSGKNSSKLPTVEAVENTIRKMTSMIEKKSAEVDILSSQLSGLSFSSPSANGSVEDGREKANGVRDSPNFTSQKYKRSRLRNGQRLALPLTPQRESPLRNVLNDDGTPRKGALGLNQNEIESYKAKMRTKREVNEMVRTVFGNGRERVRPLD